MELVPAMAVSQAGRIVAEHDTRLMRIIKHYVIQARKQVDMRNVAKITLDETSTKKGHNYMSVFIDADKENKRVVFITEGKDHTVVKQFTDDLTCHQGDPKNITQVCADMSKAFTKGIEENLPNADLVYDRFHVMQVMLKALDEVRREETKTNQSLTGSRYAWLHNPETMTKNQEQLLNSLIKQHTQTAKAYQIRLALRDIYEIQDYHMAEAALKRWYFWATHSRIEPIIKAAKTIKAHWHGVLNFFIDRMTNGIAEGINSTIQTIKRRARGYANTTHFITMIYLVCGRLNFNLPRVCIKKSTHDK
jgi:transposase